MLPASPAARTVTRKSAMQIIATFFIVPLTIPFAFFRSVQFENLTNCVSEQLLIAEVLSFAGKVDASKQRADGLCF